MREWLFLLQLQISIAVVVVLLLRQAMKKMPKVYSYLLWLLVFARLLVPISIESRFSFMPSEQERDAFVAGVLENLGEDSAVTEMPENPGEGFVAAGVPSNPGEDSIAAGIPNNPDENFADGQIGSSNTDVDFNATTGDGTGADEMSAEGMQSSDIYVPDTEGLTAGGENVAGSMVSGEEVPQGAVGNSSMMWILIAVWAVGITIVLGYNGLALRKVRRRLQNARYLVDNIQIGAGNAPVYASENINTPFSLGFLNPVIYLPTGLSDSEQEYILCHERVHIGRKDNLVKHVAFLLTAIYWFNPFVWVAFFLMERDMEMSCDEKVLKIMGKDIKRNYSQSLLDFAARPKEMPATHLTFGENSVKQRVKNVLSYKNAKKWSVAIGAVVLVVVVVALFTTGREESEQVDGQDDQVVTDGQGSVASGEESRGDGTASGEDSLGGADNGSGAGQGINDSGEGNQNADTTNAYLTTEEAVERWIADFTAQNENVVYGSYDYNTQANPGIILYFVEEGWNRYALQETIKIVEVEPSGLYRVEQESLTDYSTIETNDQFEALYGTPGARNLNLLRYDASYYRSILQQLHTNGPDGSYCVKFLDPVTAAVEMLNLGEGSGVAKLKDGSVISEGGTLGGVVLDSILSGGTTNGTGASNQVTNGLNMRDAYIAEGTYAYVTYTFAKDGSQVEIPMRLIEGSYGLWSVDADAVREVYATEEFLYYDRDPGYDLEFTEYGIYRNAGGVLINIFPYYIRHDLAWDEEDGILYFPMDAFYQEGFFDYSENMICMLDIATGEFDKETLSLESLPAGRGPITDICVEAGYLTVYCRAYVQNATSYSMPLINTGNTALATGYTYKGKAVKDLTAEERDAYSVELRNIILKKGEVMKLSNRTMKETYAYVDLDGDGKAEKITLLPESTTEDYGYVSRNYDNFRLQVGDSMVTGKMDLLENELWFFSFDGENIVIALYSAGFSDDYTTELYVYKNGELRNVGTVESRIDDLTLDQARGILHVEDAYHHFMQPVWIRKDWVLNEDGQMEEIPQDTYEIVMGRTILPDLLVPLPVHETPGGEEVTYIQPQKVDFLRFNSTFDWVYIEAADGTSGWFEIEAQVDSGVTVRIVDLNLNHWEVFTLYYAG